MTTPTFQLVTEDQALRHLRYGAEADLVDLADKIEQASAIVMDFLKLSSYPDAWLDTDGSPSLFTVPPTIINGTLLVLGALDKDRLGERDPLTPGATALLSMYRVPTVA